jgi:asparagine synthase (glutamine-hydrolysing)
MCRISGSVNIPDEWIERSVYTQRKGGPDYFNWCRVDSRVNFGHTLLSIIGQQKQPVEWDRYSITFNGCWYTFKDFYPEEKSDTIALIKHFESKGLEAIHDITGMFAFGLYDHFDKKIHLYVDRLGEKPLYYFHEGNRFAFASSPAALIPLKEKWKLNRTALESYWYLGSVFGEHSLFDGIKKLMPAHHLTYDIDTNQITHERYWKPTLQAKTDDIEEHVFSAINAVKVADVPVNIFLSGGIDSTIVASQFAGYGAVHMDSPELQYAQKVSSRFGLNLIQVESKEVDSLKCLQDYSKECGEPTMAGLIPYITSEQTAKHGKVAITANGADEQFCGYDRIQWPVARQMRHIFRPGYEKMYTDMYLKWFKIDQDLFDVGGTRWAELMTYVAFDLNKTLDFASMCHGLEVRSPFLNHHLVEKALSIPKEKHLSQRFGHKSILKTMLSNMGFDDAFLKRQKLGFSLHNPPTDLEALKKDAYDWAKKEGFVNLDESQFLPRDWNYTLSSAIGFKAFWDVWKEKLE